MNHSFVRWMRVAIVCGHIAISCTSLAAAEPITIVAFGDSTTAARGDLTVYCDLLQTGLTRRGIPVRVINSGVGGNHTQHARKRFARDVLEHHPEIVIIQFGINDSAVDVWKTPPAEQPRVALAVFKKNLRHFVTKLRHSQVQVVLMTPNPLRWNAKMKKMYGKPPYRPEKEEGFNVLLHKYAEAVRKVAKAEHVPLVDVARAFAAYGAAPGQSVSDLLLDGMHPNEKGHRVIASALMEHIVRQHRVMLPAVKKKAP